MKGLWSEVLGVGFGWHNIHPRAHTLTLAPTPTLALA